MEDLLRQIGIGLGAFIVGMNLYVLSVVYRSKKMNQHKKMKAFHSMTNSLLWLYINQTILFMMIIISRYARIKNNVPLNWIDIAGIPLFLSYIGFNVFLIKRYIYAAINGKLFEQYN